MGLTAQSEEKPQRPSPEWVDPSKRALEPDVLEALRRHFANLDDNAFTIRERGKGALEKYGLDWVEKNEGALFPWNQVMNPDALSLEARRSFDDIRRSCENSSYKIRLQEGTRVHGMPPHASLKQACDALAMQHYQRVEFFGDKLLPHASMNWEGKKYWEAIEEAHQLLSGNLRMKTGRFDVPEFTIGDHSYFSISGALCMQMWQQETGEKKMALYARVMSDPSFLLESSSITDVRTFFENGINQKGNSAMSHYVPHSEYVNAGDNLYGARSAEMHLKAHCTLQVMSSPMFIDSDTDSQKSRVLKNNFCGIAVLPPKPSTDGNTRIEAIIVSGANVINSVACRPLDKHGNPITVKDTICTSNTAKTWILETPHHSVAFFLPVGILEEDITFSFKDINLVDIK